jgi:hypothetical protein
MNQPAENQDMKREVPKPKASRAAYVSGWCKRIQAAKAHWEENAFSGMRKDMAFARGIQWEDQNDVVEERYVANLTLRHLSNKTASLYAKNPKAVAKRRERLDFQVWDGNPDKLTQAVQTLTQIQQQYPGVPTEQLALVMPGLEQQIAILDDAQKGVQQRQMIEKVGKTLEVTYEYQLNEQIPTFKTQMKQLVRRTLTTGVGYLKLGFHRMYEQRPEHADRVSDVSEQLAALEQLMADARDDEIADYEAGMEELKQTMEQLQANPDMIVREGLDMDFPPATSLIIDPDCRQLQGFIGARWLAQEFLLSPDQVKRIYKVDLENSTFNAYDEKGKRLEGSTQAKASKDEDGNPGECHKVCVWELYDRTTGRCYVFADGYPDYLQEPEAPYVRLEQFFPFFPLVFNAIEDEDSLFPPSDVTLMRHMQVEHNVSRQRLREHRDANRPKYAAPKGRLSSDDKTNLQYGDAHVVVELDGMQPGDRIADLVQPLQFINIDPNLYEVGSFFDDILKVEGTQEANMGGTSGATATESSIAEQARATSIGSNVDDLDDFLSDVARAASQVLLTELSSDTVKEIAGPGAVWPELSASEIAQELWLTVRAGSSGKPNKAQEIQNFERMAPLLMQIPGISPDWMAREAIERLDDRIDLAEAYVGGMPSITAMNSLAGKPAEPVTDDPNAQGGQGGDNAERPPESDANMGPNNEATGPAGPSSPVQGGVI